MQIDVFSDTVCPWCRIGKRHLELALADWPGEPVTVRYRSFFLDPTTPLEGRDFKAHMSAKFNGRGSLEDLFAVPAQRGAAVGLTFNFEAIERAPNTLLSHRLVYMAPEEARPAVLEAIFAAYFEQGRDIGDPNVLVELAESVGLDGAATRATLLDDTDDGATPAAGATAAVLVDVDFARQVGISGVPFFIFNNQYAFSGAQPPESIRRVMEQVAAETVSPG